MQNELKIYSIINNVRNIHEIQYINGNIDNMDDIIKTYKNIDELSNKIFNKKYNKFEQSILGGSLYDIFKLDKLNINLKKNRKYVKNKKKSIIDDIKKIKKIIFLNSNGNFVHIYLKDGKIHNENGHGIQYPTINRFSKYYINDIHVSYEQWNNYIRKIKIKKLRI